MKIAFIASVIALVTAVAATPTLSLYPFPGCVFQPQADLFIKRFSGLLNGKGSDLGDVTTTANILVADDFQEISNSILELIGLPLGGPSAASKQEYIAGISHAPPSNGIVTLNTWVTGCHSIVWRWQFNGVGSSRYPVSGFNYFDLTAFNQIHRLYVEFDSVAWGLNTGYKFVYPNGTVVPA
nr:hypothetical protein CFP56_53638 [Quercus suber]